MEDSDIDDTDSLDFEKGEPCISVNALAGNQTFSTMRVKGMVQDKSLHILLDSGSTHNFLDLQAARNMNCMVEPVVAHNITVADGNQITCQGMVRNFVWKFNGQEFCTDVLLIPLGSCDMVLGVQWLSKLGTIKWDFHKLLMEFMLNDRSKVRRPTNSKTSFSFNSDSGVSYICISYSK